MNTPRGRRTNSMSIKPTLGRIWFRNDVRWRNKTVESSRTSSVQGPSRTITDIVSISEGSPREIERSPNKK